MQQKRWSTTYFRLQAIILVQNYTCCAHCLFLSVLVSSPRPRSNTFWSLHLAFWWEDALFSPPDSKTSFLLPQAVWAGLLPDSESSPFSSFSFSKTLCLSFLCSLFTKSWIYPNPTPPLKPKEVIIYSFQALVSLLMAPPNSLSLDYLHLFYSFYLLTHKQTNKIAWMIKQRLPTWDSWCSIFYHLFLTLATDLSISWCSNSYFTKKKNSNPASWIWTHLWCLYMISVMMTGSSVTGT